MNGPDTGTLPILLVLEGGRAGERIAIPEGRWSIGRDATSDIVLDDAGVSRRHAQLTSAGATLTIEDVGSTNGTLVNGTRLSQERLLSDRDEVRMGAMAFRLEMPPGGASSPAAVPAAVPLPLVARHCRSIPDHVDPAPPCRLGRVVLVGALANLVLLTAAVIIEFATDWTGIGPWLAAPLLGMVAALVDVGKQAATREPESAARASSSAPGASSVRCRRTPPVPAAPPGPVPRPKRRVPVLVAVVVTVLLIGGGGVAIAYGVATATAFITGNQTGTDRLTARGGRRGPRA